MIRIEYFGGLVGAEMKCMCGHDMMFHRDGLCTGVWTACSAENCKCPDYSSSLSYVIRLTDPEYADDWYADEVKRMAERAPA